jgi:hypothetical protein
LVNLAGRGRMQTQRAAKLFMFRQLGIRTAKCGSRLDEANEEFSRHPATAQGRYVTVTRTDTRLDSSVDLWKLFQSGVDEMRDPGEFPHAARKVFRISEDLLNRMDAMVEICVGLPGDGPALTSRAIPRSGRRCAFIA